MSLKSCGPTFANELKAAGLLGLPFSWGADGTFYFNTSVTETQQAAIQAVYATHDPSKQDYTIAAQMALDKSDITVLRCFENAVPVPTAWGAYRTELRAIAKGTSTDALPIAPAFPAGT